MLRCVYGCLLLLIKIATVVPECGQQSQRAMVQVRDTVEKCVSQNTNY